MQINKRVSSGKSAKRNGQVFEKYLEASCIRYRTKGIADINKTPEPMKPIGVVNKRLGHFKAVYEKKGQPDFLGTLKGGKSIMFEAKHTEATNLPFNRILPQQERDLENTTKLGGLALVIISFNLRNFYSIEWTEWKRLKETIGKKSVNEKDLEAYKIEFKNGYLQFLNE